MSMVTWRGKELLVHARGDHGRAGAWCLKGGLAAGLPCLVLFFVTRQHLPLLWVLACVVGVISAVFVLVGGGFVLTNRVSVIDAERRSVSVRGQDVAVADVSAIVALSRVESVQSQHGTQESLRFELALIVAAKDSDMAKLLRALRSEIDEVIGSAMPKAAYRGKVRKQLAGVQDRLVKALAAAPIETASLCESADESAVWRAAEILAANLDVPVVDLCGGRAELRSPAELDLSLRDRLKKGLTSAEEPGLPPGGVHVIPGERRLQVTWQRSPSSTVWMLIGAFALAAGGAITLGVSTDNWWIALVMFVPFTLLVLIGAQNLRMAGAHSLTVDEREVVVESGALGCSRRESIPLDLLELLRVNHQLQPSLNLMSDGTIIRLLMDEEKAHWLRDRIEFQIARQVGAINPDG